MDRSWKSGMSKADWGGCGAVARIPSLSYFARICMISLKFRTISYSVRQPSSKFGVKNVDINSGWLHSFSLFCTRIVVTSVINFRSFAPATEATSMWGRILARL